MKMNLFKFNYKKCYKTTFYGAFTKKFIITFAKKGGLKCVNQNESFYIQLFKICFDTETLNLSMQHYHQLTLRNNTNFETVHFYSFHPYSVLRTNAIFFQVFRRLQAIDDYFKLAL